MGLPLEGVRVLAVEQYGAGPFGTQHLADLGAEVIKVENRHTGGDYARALGPYFVEGAKGDDNSLFFQSINRNKKSLTLDLGQSEAQQIFRQLVVGADAVANNLRGDVPEKLGLTYDALKSANAAIVCAHCSGYGREGPRRDWPGYDYLMQAETGYFHLTGEPEAPPTRVGMSVVDFMAGTYMALGLVAGVLSARSTGKGRDIDVNLYDTALYNLSYLNTWALNSGYDPLRVPRSAHVSLVPCQLYRTSDGWIYVMCNKEKFWPELCEAVGRPDLARDPQFATFADRLSRRDELTVILDEAFSVKSSDQWLRKLRGHVPVAPIRTPLTALQDSSLEAEEKIETLALDGGEGFRMLRSPISTGDDNTARACPPMGRDTVEVLQAAGYSARDIAEFREKNLI